MEPNGKFLTTVVGLLVIITLGIFVKPAGKKLVTSIIWFMKWQYISICDNIMIFQIARCMPHVKFCVAIIWTGLEHGYVNTQISFPKMLKAKLFKSSVYFCINFSPCYPAGKEWDLLRDHHGQRTHQLALMYMILFKEGESEDVIHICLL